MTDYSLTLNKRNDIVRKKKDILFICMNTIRKEKERRKEKKKKNEKIIIEYLYKETNNYFKSHFILIFF
jgi:hypothetical protein